MSMRAHEVVIVSKWFFNLVTRVDLYYILVSMTGVTYEFA